MGGLGLKDPVFEYQLSHVISAIYMIFSNDLRGITQCLLSWIINGKRKILKDMVHTLKMIKENFDTKDIQITYDNDITHLNLFDKELTNSKDASTISKIC
uniref:Cytochrome P450 n=1 Tax=Strongyloides stercoralis TaxID=6248 RepID=A0A0K0DS51_STRER